MRVPTKSGLKMVGRPCEIRIRKDGGLGREEDLGEMLSYTQVQSVNSDFS